jgi:transposase
MVGIDVGLHHFYTDSDGNKIENPRFLRKSEKALKRAQKRVSRKTKGSKIASKPLRDWVERISRYQGGVKTLPLKQQGRESCRQTW